jgi:hypothetical protein
MKNKQVIPPLPSLPKPLQPPPHPLRRRGRKRGCGRQSRQGLSLGRNYKSHTNPAFRRNATNNDRVAFLRNEKYRERDNILPSDASLRLALLRETINYRIFIFLCCKYRRKGKWNSDISKRMKWISNTKFLTYNVFFLTMGHAPIVLHPLLGAK